MTLSSIRKALAPAILALIAVVTEWIVTGAFDELEVRTILAGAITTLAVYFVPNDTSRPVVP